jgi:hypothetical protein
MSFPRCIVLLTTLLLLGLSSVSFAAERFHGTVTKTERALRGTWYSAEGSITFKNNGTLHYKGKRYFYAITNGGLIQLSGKHSSNAIPYQLSGGKLTLLIDGEEKVYSRKRRGR